MNDPTTGARPWGGRLPLVDRDDLDGDQRELDRELREKVVPWADQMGFAATADDGQFIGPMNIYLQRPQVSRGYLDWILAEQRESSLSAKVREVVVLTIAAAWRSEYIAYSHAAIARNVGLAESAVSAILHGSAGSDLTREELASHRFAAEVVTQRTVSTETYELAVQIFGESGVIDMANLVGIYLAASALQNAFEVPAPASPWADHG
ncbi:MAG TPA: carboxymuconolactone decarboxylase family protein [Pseudonocardia sp.]|jgi:4-carboxymuconolactone decarboxylase|nr:carboxymuconolactone decarboxylase family protein [Pseudonocardia sp.]